jgi:hypothetical protein
VKDVCIFVCFNSVCHLSLATCQCSGHGSCVTVESNYDSLFPSMMEQYYLWDAQHVTSCFCDIGKATQFFLFFLFFN